MALTFAHLREVNVARCIEGWNHPLNNWSLADWIIAVGGELGEALNVIKKLNRERDGIIGNSKGAEQLTADLADEIADTVIYLDLMLASEAESFSWYSKRLGTVTELRQISVDTLDSVGPLSFWATGALEAAGRIAECTDERCRAAYEEDELADAATELASYLALICEIAGIDLGAAVVSKFNRTSEKHGMPHRLVA